MNIAVIEDEKYSREELIHQILDVLPDARILQACSGVEGLELIEREAFDLLFIDVRLGDMLGTTVASLARKLQPNARVVFATAYSEYGVKAFELGVHNYILKPFDPKRVRQVLRELQTSFHTPNAAPVPVQKMAVTVNRHTTLIDVDKIAYIESSGSGRHCIIHMTDQAAYTTTASLGGCEAKLASSGFFRIHKTCLVQLKYIQDIFPWSNNDFGLHMQGFADVLPIGRDKVKALRQLLNF